MTLGDGKLKVAIVSTSARETSRSRAAARIAFDHIMARSDVEASLLDLRESAVDAYPGPKDHPGRSQAVKLFEAADAHVIATPVHNWGPAASTVAFLNHALDPTNGRRFRPVVLIGGAGSHRSHLALDGLARTMISELDAVLVGKPLIVGGDDVEKETGAIKAPMVERIQRVMDVLLLLAGASRRA